MRERILQGIHPPEQFIPSDKGLTTVLQVSRATPHYTSTALPAEGYVKRRPTQGTSICPGSLHIQQHAGRNRYIQRQIVESGFQPKQNIIRREYRSPTQEEAEQMKLEPGEQVLAVEEEIANLLHVSIGSPLLVLDRIVTNDMNRPVILGKELYNGVDGFRMNMTTMLY